MKSRRRKTPSLAPFPHEASYLQRLSGDRERTQKLAIAAYVAANLISPNDHVFVASGTTAALTGIEILCRQPTVKIHTHSVPFAWHFMELLNAQLIPNSASQAVELIRGRLDGTTGILQNTNLKNLTSTVFLYAPHGITDEGITNERDVSHLHAAWMAHEKIVLLATHTKLLQGASQFVKKMGHIKKENQDGSRRCELVMPDSPAYTLTKPQEHTLQELLKQLIDAGIKVHTAPPCQDSIWATYFSNHYPPKSSNLVT